MTDDSATEGGALIRIKVVAAKLATGDTTNGVDEVGPVKILEPVLVRIVGIGTTVEVVSRRVFPTLLVTCILKAKFRTRVTRNPKESSYAITFFVEHKGSNSPPGIGTVPGLAPNADSGTAPTELILSSRNGARRHRHG